MNDRIKLILVLLLFGGILTFSGVKSVKENFKEYNEDIYISQKIDMVSDDNNDCNKVIGQLYNRGDNEVCIESLKIYVEGRSANKKYYNYIDYANIKIKPHTYYNFNCKNIRKIFDRAWIYKCVINNKEVDLKYSSDGQNFEKSNDSKAGGITKLAFGSMFLLSIVGIIVYDFVGFVKMLKEI